MTPIKNGLSVAATGILAVGLLLVTSGGVLANHHQARGLTGSQIELGPFCAGPTTYSADTSFYVQHGWFSPVWSDLSGEEKRDLMHRATTFKLFIDGELQKSSMSAGYDPATDTMEKLFTTEIHGGLPEGTYLFRGEWHVTENVIGGDFRDSFIVVACDVPVEMV